MHALLAAVALASEASGEHKQLEMGDMLVYLAIIAGAVFFVVIAGLGYFTFGDDDKH